jgi:sulfopyruvate decarboxylase alpha subunit
MLKRDGCITKFYSLARKITIYDGQHGKDWNGAMNVTTDPGPTWQETIFRVLKEGGVRQIAYVPDAGHSQVIRRAVADAQIHDVVLTTEEEGVALACGAWLGGQRAALLMQSSGVGNCVNMFSLLQSGDFPFLTLVTMRGEYAEFNPWQGPMGKATQAALELMGIHVLRVSRPDDVGEIVSAALDAAFEAGEKVAVLLGQNLIGRKKWERNQ